MIDLFITRKLITVDCIYGIPDVSEDGQLPS
jgi:hypothetical protein